MSASPVSCPRASGTANGASLCPGSIPLAAVCLVPAVLIASSTSKSTASRPTYRPYRGERPGSGGLMTGPGTPGSSPRNGTHAPAAELSQGAQQAVHRPAQDALALQSGGRRLGPETFAAAAPKRPLTA